MKLNQKVVKLLGVALMFAYAYGQWVYVPLAQWADNNPDVNPLTAMILLNLPWILLTQLGGYVLYGKLKIESISVGLGAYLGWLFMDFYEPPFTILENGAINTSVMGWKSTSDTVAAWIFQNYWGITGPSLYAFTLKYGAILYLLVGLLIGGVPVLKKIFSK